MRTALVAIKDMKRALRAWARSEGRRSADVDGLDIYADSMVRKLELMEHHVATLTRVDWDIVGALVGELNIEPASGKRTALSLLHPTECGYAVLVDSRRVAELVVHAAFDGVVAASVNACDTLGRLINLTYSLGVREENANLPMVATKLDLKSPLGRVLRSEPGIEWMGPLRRLRGECQHGMLTEVLYQGIGSTVEYTVASAWHFDGVTNARVSVYALATQEKTTALLERAAAAILADPVKALSR